MNHGRDEEIAVVPLIVELAKNYRIGTVAVQDVRYLLKDDHEAYHVFRRIGAEEKNGENRSSRISAPEYYLKSADEMCSWASAFPESITNTFLIAERCSFTFETDPCRNRHYPVYIADNRSSGSSIVRSPDCKVLLLSRCLANIRKQYGFSETDGNSSGRKEVLNRLNDEIDRIDKTGYTGLFLILSDFTQWAREQEIPVGPGRGNSTASITAYLAGITEIDPVRHGLVFESFLNPEYGIFPEFSMDVCDRRRSEVVAYFKDKFGSDWVARSLTTHRMKAKSMLFDIGRTLGFSHEEIGSIVSMIPDDPKISMTGIMELEPIKSLTVDNLVENERIRKLFVYSKSIEGLMRTSDIHSCGLIIGNGPLTDTVPVGHTDTGELCTQFTAEACGLLGLLQINILGWKLLTVIGDAVRLISRHRGIAIDIHSIPPDDPTTFRLIRTGDAGNLLFLESEDVRDACRKVRVNSFDDLVAVLSLIPETSQKVKDSWIRRRTGEEPVTYNIPGTETVLLETCGLVLYREQIVQIIHLFSGLSFSRSVQLFRSLKEIGESVRSECGDMFHDGCIARGMPKTMFRALWKFLAASAGSVQDRSHMAACTTVAYRAAYLKANFPVEYLDAVKSAENDNDV
jgi:DNA polymerase-3 subunit alpha